MLQVVVDFESWKFWAAAIVFFFVIFWLGWGRDQSSTPETPEPAYTVIPIAEVPVQNLRNFKSIGEELTCTAFEEIIGRPVLINYRPNFLRNPETGRNLEFDCYDPESKTAIEYGGYQHYVFPNRFHPTEKDFQNQLKRDRLKATLAAANGVRLIDVPYTIDTCVPDPNEPSGHKRLPVSQCTKDQRRERIYSYLRSSLGSTAPIQT